MLSLVSERERQREEMERKGWPECSSGRLGSSGRAAGPAPQAGGSQGAAGAAGAGRALGRAGPFRGLFFPKGPAPTSGRGRPPWTGRSGR
jgi:hypothetical protein